MVKIGFSFLFICTSLFIFAQPINTVTPAIMLEVADEKYAENDYYNAVEWYEKAYKELRDQDVALRIADLHYTLRDFKRAESWYSRIVKRDKDKLFPNAIFNYARALKRNGKYPEAFDQFVSFLEITTNDDLRKLAALEVKGIQEMEDLPTNEEILVVNVGSPVNSFQTDASPSLDADGNLYFSAITSREPIVLDGKDQDYHAKIYRTSRGKSGKWQKPKPLAKNINSPSVHTGNVAVSRDGSKMYFSKMVFYGTSMNSSRLFVAEKRGDRWASPKEIKGVNGNYIIKNPTPGELFGDEVLFFSANIEGGQGGFDLYYSTHLGNDEYSTPTTLGENINTPGDDITPFWSDATLYFSTDGRPGLGGLDIHKTTWDGTKWSDPENMGMRYNSSVDDLFFTLDPTGQGGFLVSNRPSAGSRSLKGKTCCDELFFFQEKQINIEFITGVFNPEGPLLGATVNIYEMLEGDFGKSSSQTNDETNAFGFALETDKAYTVVYTRDGYYPDSLTINTVGIVDDHQIQRNMTLQPIPVEPETEIITVTEPIRLNNIFYDFDDDQILPDAEKDLAILLELLNQYPDMVIELSSHTDAQGNDEYNDDLSLRRATSAVNWLLERGIEETRVKAVGYGEQFILNRCVNGVECDDNEHRFNRRTEFKILEGPRTIEIKKEILKGNPQQGGGGYDGGARSLFTPIWDRFQIDTDKLRAKIKFDESFHDFGLITKGDVKTHDFYFTNVGSSELKISIVTGASKTTTIKWPREGIKPKERGKIEVTYDSSGEYGEEEVTIHIVANSDPIISEARFRVFVDGF